MGDTVKTSLMIGFALAALTAGSAAAKNALNPGEETQLHVPRMKAPTLDGKITQEEWGHATL